VNDGCNDRYELKSYGIDEGNDVCCREVGEYITGGGADGIFE